MSTTASTDHLSSVDVEMFKAIANGDIDAFADALGAGANTNAEYAGWTPMTLAMHHLEGRCVPFVTALVHTGADVNQCERASGTDRTPLLFALHGGSLSVVKMLLDAGANPTAPDRDGHTPLKLAQLAGDPLLSAAMGSAVVQRKDGNTSMPDELNLALELLTGALQGVAASHGGAEQARAPAPQQEVVQQVGDSSGSNGPLDGLDLTDDLEARFSRLLDACANGDLVQVQALVVNHEDDLLKLQLDDGRDALHFAVAGGHGPIVQHLVDHGADIEAQAYHRPEGPHTPLDLARVLNHADAVAVLECACEAQGVEHGEHRDMIGMQGPDGQLVVRVLNKYTRETIGGTMAARLEQRARELHAQKNGDKAPATARPAPTRAVQPAVPVVDPAPMVVSTSPTIGDVVEERKPFTFLGRWAQRRMEKQVARRASREAKSGPPSDCPTTAAPASAPQAPVSSTATSTTRPAWYEEVERSLEFFEPRRLELAQAAAKATEQDIAAFSLQPGGELGHFVTVMVAVAEWVASVGRVYAMSLANNEDMTLDEVQFARLAYREAVGGVMQRLVLHPFSVPMESMDQEQFMTLYDIVANLSPRTDLYPDDLKAALSIVLSSRYLVHSCLLLLARVALGLMTLDQLPRMDVFDRFHQQYESTDPTRDRENIYPRAADLQAVCTLSVEVETLLGHDRAGHLAKRFPSAILDGMTDERLLVLTKAWLAQLGAYRSTIEVTDNGQLGVKNSASFTDVLRDISQGGSLVQVTVLRDAEGADNAVVYLDDGADGFADYLVAVTNTVIDLGVRSTTTSVALS